MDKHIQVGLHGHHHVCQVTFEYKSIIDEDKLLIISAGTLYGNTKSLPSGTKRQYNLIEFEIEAAKAKITINSREDKSQSEYAIPSWGEGRIGDSSNSSWTTEVLLPKQPSFEEKLNLIMKNVEQTQDYSSGARQLIELDIENPLTRKFFLEYLTKSGDYQLIYNYFRNPRNNAEAISVLNAVIELNDSFLKREILTNEYIKNNTDSSVKYLVNQIKY